MRMYSLNQLYKVVDISKQAVHQYEKKQISYDEKLYELITQVDLLRAEHPGCGIEKMYYTLQPDFMGRDKFIVTMMNLGYRIRRVKNFTKTTFPGGYYYPNLIEGSLINDINRIWQTDITYIYINDRFYYLIFIVDVYSRKVLGFSVANHMRAEANVNALNQSFRERKQHCLSNLVHHSDRGSQYISKAYTTLLLGRYIKISMGTIAMENPFAERVNGIIKNEYLKLWNIKTFGELKTKVKKAVKHYNNKRIHNSLPKRMTPSQFENNLANTAKRRNQLTYSFNYPNMNELKKQYSNFETNFDNWHCPILIKNEISKSQKTVNLF